MGKSRFVTAVWYFRRCGLIAIAVVSIRGSHVSASSARIFNTGVDDNGALLPLGAVDPHYVLLSSADPANPGPQALTASFNGAWLNYGPNSGWIAPSGASMHAPGDYVYRTTLDLTGLNPSLLQLSGQWATDNTGTRILLNGVDTGTPSITTPSSYTSLHSFNVASGFQAGLNTLDFLVHNDPGGGLNPTGFRAELNLVTPSPPPPPRQKVVLVFDKEGPAVVRKDFKSWLTQQPRFALDTSKSTPKTTMDSLLRTDILERVQQIFRDSGITSVEVTDVDDGGDASRIYFTDMSNSPARTSDGTLYGNADGFDKFNSKPSNKATVFVTSGTPQEIIEQTAKTAAHEAGHTLGLAHMPELTPVPEVMSSGRATLGQLPLFSRQKQLIPGDVEGRDHSTLYHLKRWVDGVPDAVLQSEGITPGSWDEKSFLTSTFEIVVRYGANRTLYDVTVLQGGASDSDGGLEGEAGSIIAHFDSILLSELSEMRFELVEGNSFQLLAASAAGGPLDVALATGDPTQLSSLFIDPTTELVNAELVQYSESAYSVISDAVFTGTPVPEPSAGVIAVAAGIAGANLRTRRTRRRCGNSRE